QGAGGGNGSGSGSTTAPQSTPPPALRTPNPAPSPPPPATQKPATPPPATPVVRGILLASSRPATAAGLLKAAEAAQPAAQAGSDRHKTDLPYTAIAAVLLFALGAAREARRGLRLRNS
ncbi:MAG TPA: hypothetical protein VGI67_06275, partial [Thermoleophilaceae bacterium]